MAMNEPVYIIDGNRTPFLKSRNRPGPFAASDLATDAGRALLLRQAFDATRLDEVILGCPAPSADEGKPRRVAAPALREASGMKMPLVIFIYAGIVLVGEIISKVLIGFLN